MKYFYLDALSLSFLILLIQTSGSQLMRIAPLVPAGEIQTNFIAFNPMKGSKSTIGEKQSPDQLIQLLLRMAFINIAAYLERNIKRFFREQVLKLYNVIIVTSNLASLLSCCQHTQPHSQKLSYSSFKIAKLLDSFKISLLK